MRLPKPNKAQIEVEQQRLRGPDIIKPTIGIIVFGGVMAIFGSVLLSAFGKGASSVAR
jgi:hypothetical protein